MPVLVGVTSIACISAPSRGEWGFLYRLKLKDSYLGEEVSIPSRGDWGFLPNFIFICIYIISLVSVPSRGEWRLLPAILKGIGAFILFPPPLEVNGRSYESQEDLKEGQNFRFRTLPR